MSHTIVFDTLDSMKRLKAVGFTEEQAETQTRIIAEVIDERLATKQDLETKLKELELRLKHDLTLRFGGMLAVSVAVIAVLDKVWK